MLGNEEAPGGGFVDVFDIALGGIALDFVYDFALGVLVPATDALDELVERVAAIGAIGVVALPSRRPIE